jgi:hypothetical protein
MIILKSFTIVAAVFAGGTSLAMAQGPGTGDYPPVAGGAGSNPITNPGYYSGHYGGYIAAPRLCPTTARIRRSWICAASTTARIRRN